MAAKYVSFLKLGEKKIYVSCVLMY